LAADTITPDLAKCNATLSTVIDPVKTGKEIREATVKLFFHWYILGLENMLMT